MEVPRPFLPYGVPPPAPRPPAEYAHTPDCNTAHEGPEPCPPPRPWEPRAVAATAEVHTLSPGSFVLKIKARCPCGCGYELTFRLPVEVE